MSMINKSLIPVTEYYRERPSHEPFEGWETSPKAFPDYIISPWLVRNSATLLWGNGDLTALALWLVLDISWHLNFFRWGFPQDVLYLKGESVEPQNGIFPSESNFSNLLNQIPQPFFVKTQSIYKHKIQMYPEPPPLPIPFEPIFYWRIVSPKRIPWGYSYIPKSDEVDLCRELFSGGLLWSEYFKNLKVIILDGFEWTSDSDIGLVPSLKNMIKQLQEREITTILVSSNPPKKVIRSKIWDNILEVKPWRSHKCGGRNVIIQASRCDPQAVPRDFFPIHLKNLVRTLQKIALYRYFSRGSNIQTLL